MQNLILFINSLLSYLLVFAVFGIAIIGAVFLGIRTRKAKDAKNAVTKQEGAES